MTVKCALIFIVVFATQASSATSFKMELPKPGSQFEYSCSDGSKYTKKIGQVKRTVVSLKKYKNATKAEIKKLGANADLESTWETQLREKWVDGKIDHAYHFSPKLFTAYGDLEMSSPRADSGAYPLSGTLLKTTEMKLGSTYELILAERILRKNAKLDEAKERIFKMTLKIEEVNKFKLDSKEYKTYKIQEVRKVLFGPDPYETLTLREYSPELKMITSFSVKVKGMPASDRACKLVKVVLVN